MDLDITSIISIVAVVAMAIFGAVYGAKIESYNDKEQKK